MASSMPSAAAPGAEGNGNGEQRPAAHSAIAVAAGASEEPRLLPMLHQVGGHRAASEAEPPYMLRSPPHLVLKIVQDGARGKRELGFYHRLFPEVDSGVDGSGDDDCLAFLRPFVPAFHGVRFVRYPLHQPDAPLLQYLALEDIADRDRHRRRRPRGEGDDDDDDDERSQQRPSVLDIKMGRATHGPFAPPAKAARERGKYPYQAAVGFRVIGMKVCDRATGRYETEGKAYGRGLAPEQVDDALARFFLRRCPQAAAGERRRRRRGKGSRAATAATALLGFYIGRLEALQRWFQGQRLARFWSSSLLFVDHEEAEESEEGHEEEEEEEEVEGGRHNPADVRMIDFAHVELRGGEEEEEEEGAEGAEDENYLYGLVSLLEHLRRLHRRAAEAEAAAGEGGMT